MTELRDEVGMRLIALQTFSDLALELAHALQVTDDGNFALPARKAEALIFVTTELVERIDDMAELVSSDASTACREDQQ